jgi:hypothetical protein
MLAARSYRRVVRILIAAVLLVTACAPLAQPAPSQPPTATETTAVPATPRNEPAPTPSVAPTPTPGPRLDDPIVTVTAEPFPVLATFTLTKSAVAPGDAELATLGVQRYLEGLDRYRDNGDFLPVGGTFGKAVAAALVASRTPGVKRTFVLKSLRIEALYRKPWGTMALVDARVTIADHAVDGSAPDQLEAGLLRLSGDRRLSVTDGWDDSMGRWFNGHVAESAAGLREAVVQPIGWHLRTESWIAGMASETYWDGSSGTPFQKARHAYIASFDRAATLSRTFADVTATSERFDTFAEMAGGIATVRVAAALVTTGPGRPQREPVTRRVKVFLGGNWMPEVVDEEVTPGVWRSGGDLALIDIDVNRA